MSNLKSKGQFFSIEMLMFGSLLENKQGKKLFCQLSISKCERICEELERMCYKNQNSFETNIANQSFSCTSASLVRAVEHDA